MADKQKYINVEILRSTFDSRYTALGVGHRRIGVDAGPWRTESRHVVSIASLREAIDQFENEPTENIKELLAPLE